ncbi:MAG TPA: DMT family transporter [Ignavibacteriaceae bacterium]|nr:DMT family transporter [Ignavibacteriaceae bacterium]
MIPNIKAILLSLLVTFLWSTSFIIIKWGLVEIPPLTFAGLRYSIAFFCIFPFAFKKSNLEKIKTLSKKDWYKLLSLGLLFYFFTQGAQFIGLSLLTSVTVSLVLNFTPVIVAVLAILLINEVPTPLQWGGAAMFIAGVVIYFFPVNFGSNEITGLIIMLIGVLANALSAVLGRNINSKKNISPFIVTVVSMGTGAVLLLSTGIVLQGLPSISILNLMYLLWLAIINTAFAFIIWNFTLRSLTAMESSIINGTMLIQIAILAYFFLGESVSLKEGVGLLIAGFGAVLVQLKFKAGFRKTKIVKP